MNNKGLPDLADMKMSDEQKALAYYKAGLRQSKAQGSFPMPPFLPSLVLVLIAVTADGPGGWNIRVMPGIHACESNKYGAISVLSNKKSLLGLRPNEFEILEWIPNPHLESPTTEVI